MTERGPTAASLTRRAIERFQEGETDDARQILAEALEIDPLYEPAWLWFAHIAEDPGERRFCLEQAAAVNPDSAAKQELPKLRRVEPVEPPELSDVIAPPPPGFAAAPTPRRIPVPAAQPARWALLGVVAVILALAASLLFLASRRESPVYVAVVSGMTGSGAAFGAELVQSARLYFDQVNDAGGINGRPVEVLVFDDENDATVAAEVARQIVADGRPLLVIGHGVSSASMAAAPIYGEAGIPAITSTSTADAMTQNNPWYFRTVFDNRTEGFLIAAYIRHVLDVDRISVIAGDDDYGRSLATGVIEAFSRDGEVRRNIEIDTSSGALAESVEAAVAEIGADPDPGVIVVAMQSELAQSVIPALELAGIDAQIVGGDAIGSNPFLAALASVPGAPAGADQITDGLLAASPLIMDSLTSDSLRWFEAFRDAYDHDPTWRGATTYDAAIATMAAMRAAGITGDPEQRVEERQRIRDALASFDSPERALAGLLGPIYFDGNNTTPRPAAFGVAQGGLYSSAQEQLRPYLPSSGLGLEDDLASGVAIDVEGQILERQRIVFTGVNLNEIGELDTANPSFYADFFLWFNYSGDDSATDIVFVNAVEPDLALGDPIRTVVSGNSTYQLYRVTGRFKAPLEFQDFPFDKQQLIISFQNRTLPSSKLVYAVDRELLERPQEDRLRSGTNAAVSINAIPSWEAIEVQVYQDTIGSTASLGDPEAMIGSSGIEYSLFTADVTVERDLAAFLGKNLLPLALLAAVTYVSLFFPHTLTEARVTFGVTGILTAAVILSTVTGVLPQVGYTVAIEWGFYAFILLSATCIVFALIGDTLYDQRRLSELRRLDLISRIFYPVFVLVVVLAYVVRYGGSV